MSKQNTPESTTASDFSESFDELFAQYEQNRSRRAEGSGKGREATVIAISGDSVFLDIGFKTEGILPLGEFQSAGETLKPGDKLTVAIKGRDPEGYYQLSRFRAEQPKDWQSLERAFADQSPIAGTVTGIVKGGLNVDVGVRAFLPASRSGVRNAAEMEKLVGQDIRCRVIKLDVSNEDVVVDRRAVAEEEERAAKQRRYSEIREGDTLQGTVRSLADYGAFVDIGGVDALLHVSDIAWSRVSKPEEVLSPGQQIEVKVLKVDPEKRRISVGMKQLQAHPWDAVAGKYKPGERIRGAVTRVTDFGAFVELEPGVEGLIHVSEMSWVKRVKKPADLVKAGETVEAVILGVDTAQRRMSLGLKQALGDPWADVAQKFPVGSMIEGVVTNLTKFGAFVQVEEGIEGMIHVGEISAEKRLNHPQDALKLGQPVKAQVLEADKERRLLRLSIKQLVPSGLDEYVAEHREGDVVTGRVVEISAGTARVELGEGVLATCRATLAAREESAAATKADLSSLSSMLSNRWKGGAASPGSQADAFRGGQIRSFRIMKLDPAAKRIELDPA